MRTLSVLMPLSLAASDQDEAGVRPLLRVRTRAGPSPKALALAQQHAVPTGDAELEALGDAYAHGR